MQQLLERIKTRLSEGTYPNEASISHGIVMPILRALGWDDTDPSEVMPEYASGGRRVDFALCALGTRPSLFIEVKGIGRAVEGDRQLFEYAFHEGIPLCLLTDGRDWSFYLPGGQGSYDERRVYRLQLDKRPATECRDVLVRYLDKDRVRSGDAFEDALRDHRDIASKREARRALPGAWTKLVNEPEDLLVELLTEQTEALSGFRPTSAEVSEFLRSLKITNEPRQHPQRSKLVPIEAPDTQSDAYGDHRAGSRKGEVHRIYDEQGSNAAMAYGLKVGLKEASLRSWMSSWRTGTATSPKPRGLQEPSVGTGRALDFEVFGKRRSAPSASVALIEILKELAHRYPDKLPAIAAAVQGKSRNHIAQTPAEIYPARPDLARAAEIAPGWLVGLNIANREKDRIVRGACGVVGVTFGRDVIVQFPNTDI